MILDRSQIRDVSAAFLKALDECKITDNPSLIARSSLGFDKSCIPVCSSEDYSDAIEFDNPNKGFVGVRYQRCFNSGLKLSPVQMRLDYTFGEGTRIYVDCNTKISGYTKDNTFPLNKDIDSKNFIDLRDELKRLSELR